MGINDQMERDVSYIYNSYLLAKQDEHKEKYKDFKGWFSASTAGSCFRKQYYNINGYDGTQPDEKSMRLLRLGTIVVGHLDIGVYDKNTHNITVTDVKTSHSYKWKMLFGRYPDKNPSVNYYLQVATYGLGLMHELDEDIDSINLSLTWYKKDDSLLRTQKVNNEWIDYAIIYWTDLNEALEDGNLPEIGSENVPVYDWECKYCPYHKLHCEGK